MKKIQYFYYFHFLRLSAALYARIGQRQFFLIWATATGISTGIAVVVIRGLVILLQQLPGWWWFALLGIALAKVTKQWLGDRGDSNGDMVLLMRALRTRRPGMIRLQTLSHIFAAPLTIGLGGSAGLTTPGVLAGASIGAGIGRLVKIPNMRRVSLMVCGVAAGIAGIFNSPVAGVLFAVEVLLPRTSAGELLPVLFAAAGGVGVAQLIWGNQSFFSVLSNPWGWSDVPGFLVAGILSAAIGVYMVRCNRQIGAWLSRCFPSPWIRLLAGGGAAALLIGLFPVLAGEGSMAMQAIFSGDAPDLWFGHWFDLRGVPPVWLPVVFALAAVLLKIVASALTLNAGGAGGYFAPTLFTGAFAGLMLARIAELAGWEHTAAVNLIAAGMCGVFAAAFRAPLTAVFLVTEMCGSYRLMLPLIVVAAVGYFLSALVERESLYGGEAEDGGQARGERAHPGGIRSFIRPAAHVLVTARQPDWAALLRSDPAMEFAVVDEPGKLQGIVRRARVDADKMPEDWLSLMEPPVGAISRADTLVQAEAACRIYSRATLPVVDEQFRFKGWFFKPDA